MTVGSLLGLALALDAAPGASPNASPSAQPVEVIRAFYDADSIRAYGFYSRRLRTLFEDDLRSADGGVGNLDFAFHVNAQDVEDGWRDTLRIELIEKRETRAVVRVSFRNFGSQVLRYAMVRERRRWLIDEVASDAGERWLLSRVLTGKPSPALTRGMTMDEVRKTLGAPDREEPDPSSFEARRTRRIWLYARESVFVTFAHEEERGWVLSDWEWILG